MYLLYKKSFEEHVLPCADCSVKEFIPSWRSLYIYGERKSWITTIVRAHFMIIARGRMSIFYVKSQDNRILHTSYLIPRCYKFPFMKKNDFEIGPCNTDMSARRKGFYFQTLYTITTDKRLCGSDFYMLVNDQNIPSIKGIEKAGFVKVGYAKKTRILKRYVQIRGM